MAFFVSNKSFRQPLQELSLDHLQVRLLDLGVPIEQVNYLAGHKSMAMTKRYDHANEERYGAAIEALDAAGKTLDERRPQF